MFKKATELAFLTYYCSRHVLKMETPLSSLDALKPAIDHTLDDDEGESDVHKCPNCATHFSAHKLLGWPSRGLGLCQ